MLSEQHNNRTKSQKPRIEINKIQLFPLSQGEGQRDIAAFVEENAPPFRVEVQLMIIHLTEEPIPVHYAGQIDSQSVTIGQITAKAHARAEALCTEMLRSLHKSSEQ